MKMNTMLLTAMIMCNVGLVTAAIEQQDSRIEVHEAIAIADNKDLLQELKEAYARMDKCIDNTAVRDWRRCYDVYCRDLTLIKTTAIAAQKLKLNVTKAV